MSYNISRYVSPALAICSFSSAGAGVVTFSFINGDFTPMISGTQIALDAGYEYFLTVSPSTSVASATYATIIDGVTGTSYPISTTSTSTPLDQKMESILSDAASIFEITGSAALSSNSRLEIWRIPL
jgi:hypothetical protein